MEVIKQQNSEWVSEYSANRDFLIRKKKKNPIRLMSADINSIVKLCNATRIF